MCCAATWDRSSKELAGHKVSAVGLDEAMVRGYNRNQDQQDERYEIS
jgi:hypothetical protein